MLINLFFQSVSRPTQCLRTIVFALLAFLVLDPAVAQAAVKEVIDVRITSIAVVATDAKGQPVKGLTRDDFELYENGTLQSITNFFEAADGSQGKEQKTDSARRLVIYFDDSSLVPNNRKPVIPALKELLAVAMTPEDQVMIVTFNRTRSIRLPWTNDLAAANKVLDAIASDGTGGKTRQAERNRAEREITRQMDDDQFMPVSGGFRNMQLSANAYATSVRQAFGVSATSLQELLSSLSGVDGRKIVFMVSEAFPTHPGSEIFTYLEQTRNMIIASDTTSAALKQSARLATVSADASSFNTTEAVIALGRMANAAGVTIYALDPDAGGKSDSGTADRSGDDAVANLSNISEGGSSQVDGLQMLAQASGGMSWIGAKPTVAFERFRTELENYYSIGYKAATAGPVERKIEVRSVRSDVRVRSRKSVVFRTTESEMPERVTANLQSDQMNDLGISIVIAGEIVTDGKKKRVPLRVLIPARNLLFSQEADSINAEFSVFTCTAGGKGTPSSVQRQSHNIKLPLSEIERVKGHDMVFAYEVVLEEGRNQISIGVLDPNSQATGFSKIGI